MKFKLSTLNFTGLMLVIACKCVDSPFTAENACYVCTLKLVIGLENSISQSNGTRYFREKEYLIEDMPA